MRFVEAITLLVVVAIPLAAAADSYRDARTLAQIRMLEGVLELHREDTGQYPSADVGLRSLLEAPSETPVGRGPYLRDASATLDAWGEPLVYNRPSLHGSGPYDLYSKGVNLQDDLGREDDITHWSGIPRKFYPRPFPWALLVAGLLGLGALSGVGFVVLLGIRAVRKRAAA